MSQTVDPKKQEPAKDQLDPAWKAKLDRLKALQDELESAFAEAKKYQGQTEKDKEIFARIERILTEMAELTAPEKKK